MNRRLLAAMALGLAATLPAACGGGAEEDAGGEAATANPDAPEGITVSNARLMLAPVAGNPAAIYFDIENTSDRQVTIRSASVQGAGNAMLHRSAEYDGQIEMQEVLQEPVPAGETVSFEPGGLHVMAFELGETVASGAQAEVTLTFTGGDKVSFPAEIRAAGEER